MDIIRCISESIQFHILVRKEYIAPVLNVRKLMEVYGMGQYANVCINRILDLERSNGVYYDFVDSDLKLDLDGLFECSDILLGYLSLDELQKCTQFMLKERREIDTKNSALNALRKMNKKTLLHEYTNSKKRHLAIADLYIVELVARMGIWEIFYKVGAGVYNRVKYFRYYFVLSRIKKHIVCK